MSPQGNHCLEKQMLHSWQGHFLCSSLPFPAQTQLVLGAGLWRVWGHCVLIQGKEVSKGWDVRYLLWLIRDHKNSDSSWVSLNVHGAGCLLSEKTESHWKFRAGVIGWRLYFKMIQKGMDWEREGLKTLRRAEVADLAIMFKFLTQSLTTFHSPRCFS